MKVRALRGVCIGVDRHLVPGDTADLEPATVTFLVYIKAVEVVKDEPTPNPEAAPAEAEPVTRNTKPVKPGKEK